MMRMVLRFIRCCFVVLVDKMCLVMFRVISLKGRWFSRVLLRLSWFWIVVIVEWVIVVCLSGRCRCCIIFSVVVCLFVLCVFILIVRVLCILFIFSRVMSVFDVGKLLKILLLLSSVWLQCFELVLSRFIVVLGYWVWMDFQFVFLLCVECLNCMVLLFVGCCQLYVLMVFEVLLFR